MWIKITQIIKNWFNQNKNRAAGLVNYRAAIQPALILLAITIISYETVDLFYKVVSFPLINRPAVKSAGALQQAIVVIPHAASQNYSVITERNLFRTTMKALGDPQLGGGYLGASQEVSSFELRGTIAGDASFGYAILEEKAKKKQKLYRLGDPVGSAKLTRITRNTVVLLTQDREVVLKIKETPESSLLASHSAAPQSMVVSKEEVNEKMKDLGAILNQAMVRPFFNAGVQDGFIISNIKPNSIYERLGLHNGDIILDVNQKIIRTADDVLGLVNVMQEGGSVSLNIKRQGKMETINYTFQ